MKTVKGDIWKFHERGEWICVTTNGFVKADGLAVMGRGTAMQCTRRYPEAPTSLGRFIQRHGNVVGQFMPGLKILSFPVKHNWWEKADPELIRESAKQLVEIEPFIPRGFALKTSGKCYLPWPGCGNGQLQWKHVSGIIRPILDDRFVVVEYDPETV